MKKIGQKILSLLLVAVFLLTAAPSAILKAAEGDPTGTFDLGEWKWTSGSSAACALEDPVMTVGSGANITITGESTDFRRIVVAEDAKNVRITLDGATILGLDKNQAPILLSEGAEVTVVAAAGSTNILFGGDFCAGIQVLDGAELTVAGSGILQAFGGENAAGIGAGAEGSCGKITISGGNVYAVSSIEADALAMQDFGMMLAVSASEDDDGIINVEWTTTVAEGSFAVQDSDSGNEDEDFSDVGTLEAEDDTYAYTTAYSPDGTEDLYFRIVQTGEEDTATSNVIKMTYVDDVGYVQELDEELGEYGVEFDEGDEYITLTKNFEGVLENAVISISVVDQAKNSDAFESGVTVEEYIYFSNEARDPVSAYDSSNGFAVSTDGDYTFPETGFLVNITYYDDAPGVADAPTPSKSVEGALGDGRAYYYLYDLLGEPYNGSYDADTATLTVTLFETGRYVVLQNAVLDEMPEPPEPEEWKPISKLAQIVHEAGFSFDPNSGLLFARKDASQRRLGFAYFYDEGIPLISSNISCEPIYFIYDDKEWLIEVWKGQYGIELGAEIGVYNRTIDGDLIKDRINKKYKDIVREIINQIETKYFSVPDKIKEVLDKVTDLMTPVEFENALQTAFNIAKNLAKLDPLGVADFARDAIGVILFGLRSKLYDCVTDDECLPMEYTLYNRTTALFERGNEEHWWLTGFDWGQYTSDPNSLTMDATIRFPNKAMRDAFVIGYDDEDSRKEFMNKDASIAEGYAFYNNDNTFRMMRGLAGMGYREVDDIESTYSTIVGYAIPCYQLLEDEGEGYGVRFTVTYPKAKQPFFTTNMALLVNANNKNLVFTYNKLKQIIGCTSNDPNKLEEYVLKYTGGDAAWVREKYELITGAIVQVVDAAFSVAKAAVAPPEKRQAVSPLMARLDAAVFNLAGGEEEEDTIPASAIGGEGAEIVITGGTISTEAAGYGIYGASVTVTGGSIYPSGKAGAVNPQPVNSGGVSVYMTEVTGLSAGTGVTAVAVPAGYGTTDVKADADGKLYFWFPAGKQNISLTAGGAFAGTATVTNDNKAVCALSTHTHQYGSVWESDGDRHWRRCECGVTADLAYHLGGTADCTDEAVCTVCAAVYGSELGHRLTALPARAPTCSQNGNTAYWQCSDCGRIFLDAAGEDEVTPEAVILPATGHTASGDWVVDRAATATENGRRHSECTVCGQKVIEVIPAFGDPVGIAAIIDSAEEMIGSAVAGSKPGQYPQDAIDKLRGEIDRIRDILNNSAAAMAELDKAKQELEAAVKAFADSRIPLSGAVDVGKGTGRETGDAAALLCVCLAVMLISCAGLAVIGFRYRKKEPAQRAGAVSDDSR